MRSGDIAMPHSEPLERIKPYKAATPEDTVAEIRFRLAGLNLPFVETGVCAEAGRYSCCLQLVDDVRGETVFQVMGKGRTDAYARASAYGEMMERLQNLAFYMMAVYPSEPETERFDSVQPFKYYPDERGLTVSEIRRGYARLFRSESIAGDLCVTEPVLGVPFWNVFGEQVECLPLRAFQIVVGSNGMCSGNTPAEALIHGVCEVFERYVLKQLFLSPLTPPDIPLERFVGHDIYADLHCLAEENEYEIRIKDCSMGLRLPVIGLLIKSGCGQYAFHLGADPSPVTALERCLTELFQGGRILFKNVGELEDASGSVLDSEFWRAQLHLNIRSYEGHWPSALLQSEPDDEFSGFDHPVSTSDECDLDYVLGIVADAGWDLLIRDNSFLGFPSYHVYIPGIGEMTNAVDDAFAKQCLAFDRHMQVITNAAGATHVQRKQAVHAIEQYARVAPSRQFRAADYLPYYRQHPLASLTQSDLETVLRQPGPLAQTLALPACFDCDSCACASSCSQEFISAAWARMKRAMTSWAWNQSNVLNRVKSVRSCSAMP